MDSDPISSSAATTEDFLHFEPAKLQEGGAPHPKWFCLRIAPKQEHIAITHLRKIFQIEVFCPRLRYQKATRTGRRWYVEALFPSYIFARFDYLTHHRGVQYCSGVSTIVHFGVGYAAAGAEILHRATAQRLFVAHRILVRKLR